MLLIPLVFEHCFEHCLIMYLNSNVFFNSVHAVIGGLVVMYSLTVYMLQGFYSNVFFYSIHFFGS